MTAIAPSRSPAALESASTGEEQHFVLNNVTWDQYVALGNIFPDRPGLRITFDGPRVELMTTSHEHDRHKFWLGQLLVVMAEECGLKIAPFGSPTFQREGLKKGLEPDQCFWIAHERHMRGKLSWDPEQDPPPDLVIEVEVSRNILDRIAIYAALGVPEVWRFDRKTIRVLVLEPDRKYRESETSPTFPGVPLSGVVEFLQPSETDDYLSVIRSFRNWVRTQLAKP